MNDDADGNIAEVVYQGIYRDLTVEEKYMFSDDFCLEKETARVLKDIEGYLTNMAQSDRLSHRRKKEMCYEALEMVVDLRRFYTDNDY
jgi:hypothetical protein